MLAASATAAADVPAADVPADAEVLALAAKVAPAVSAKQEAAIPAVAEALTTGHIQGAEGNH